MFPLQAAVRRWIVLLAVLALFPVPLGPARHASAADASLVIAALHVWCGQQIEAETEFQKNNTAKRPWVLGRLKELKPLLEAEARKLTTR